MRRIKAELTADQTELTADQNEIWRGPAQAEAPMHSFNATRQRQAARRAAKAFYAQTLNLTWMISPSRIT
jgi:hypothetical protein